MPPNSRINNDVDTAELLLPPVTASMKSSSVSADTMKSSSSVSPSLAGNKAPAGTIDRIGAVIGKLLYATLFGYFMIYSNQNINHVFFLRNFVWLFAMVCSICQDEVQYYINKRFSRTSSTDILRSNRSASSKPGTVEYNLQVQLATGIFSYGLGILILFLFDNYSMSNQSHSESYATQFISLTSEKIVSTVTKNTANSNITTSNFSTAQDFYTTVIQKNTLVQTLQKYVVGLINDLHWSLDDTTNYNELLFQVVSILASYHMFERSWWQLFCYPLHAIDKQPTGLRAVESYTIFPILGIAVLVLKNPSRIVDLFNMDPNSFHLTTRTILYGWIILKLIQYTYSYINNNKTLTSYTYAAISETTEIAQERINNTTNHFADPSMQVGNDREHNNIWNIYGNQYDVTDFVKHHPGGTETIMLAANREDGTALFQSYHPFNIKKARSVLEKYRIVNDETTSADTTTATSNNKDNEFIKYGHENDIFYDVLCQRVAECLKGYNLHPVLDRDASWNRLTLYTIIFAINAFFFYKHCQGYILYSIVFAFMGDMAAAHVGHDGGHFAISRKYPLINDIGVWGFFLISNPIVWQHQHTYGHHSYTNDAHKDPDLHHFKGLMKTRPDEDEGEFFFDIVKKYRLHGGKNFYWYIMFVFGQVSLALSFWFPTVFIFDRSLHGVVDWSDRRQWHRTAQLLVHWCLFTFVVFCVPFMVQKNSALALVQIFSHTFTSSFIFALNTQVGHLSDGALNTKTIAEQRTKRHSIAQSSWAAEQVVTTHNFNPESDLVFFFGGGLSMQIEHHLFPYFNHCHLMKIQPVVEATCKEFNVPYQKFASWSEAWYCATRYLASLGDEQ